MEGDVEEEDGADMLASVVVDGVTECSELLDVWLLTIFGIVHDGPHGRDDEGRDRGKSGGRERESKRASGAGLSVIHSRGVL